MGKGVLRGSFSFGFLDPNYGDSGYVIFDMSRQLWGERSAPTKGAFQGTRLVVAAGR